MLGVDGTFGHQSVISVFIVAVFIVPPEVKSDVFESGCGLFIQVLGVEDIVIRTSPGHGQHHLSSDWEQHPVAPVKPARNAELLVVCRDRTDQRAHNVAQNIEQRDESNPNRLILCRCELCYPSRDVGADDSLSKTV